MMKFVINEICSRCIHFSVCKNEPSKRELTKTLNKLNIDVGPFEVRIQCPNFREDEIKIL